MFDQPASSTKLTLASTSAGLNSTSQQTRPTLRIPFRYLNGFLIVKVVINNRIPLSFIFDTGSKHTILTDESFIPFLGQLPEEEIRIVGSDLGVPITGHIMRRTGISVGDVDLENQSLILLDGGILALSVLIGEPIHGILGVGAFGAYGLKINYQTGILELIESQDIRKHKKATILPIRLEKSKAYIDIQANIHPGKSQNLSLLIDTGASLSLLIHTNKSDTTLFPPRIITGTFGYGLGGYLEGYVGRSDLIKLGPFDLPDVITHFQTFAEINSFENIPVREGIIGNGILDRFTLLIDFNRNELHLLPTKRKQRPLAYDRSGIRLVRDGEELNKLRIQHVVKDSPADRAGIVAGDELLKIGIFPIAWVRLGRIESILRGRVGKAIRLTTKANGVEVEKKIVLEELI